MALKNKPTMLGENISAPATLPVGVIAGENYIRNDEYNRPGMLQTNLVEILATSGDPTFSAQPQQSLDGTNWHAIGEAITTAGLSSITVQAPYFNVDVTALTGGDITVSIC